MHCLGGGTGSGMGSLLLNHLREDYSNKVLQSMSVLSSPKVSDTVVEPYNVTLALHHLTENADMCMLIDNEALYNICLHRYKCKTPTYADLNYIATQALSGATCGLRFPGQLNHNLRKMATGMIPFPRLHYFSISQAPITPRSVMDERPLSASFLTTEMFSAENCLCTLDPQQGRFLSVKAHYRG